MSTFGYFFVIAFALVLSLNSATAMLRCWRCSTDVSDGEFCNDPFDGDNIKEQQRYWSYVNCTNSIGVKSRNVRPVCKKLVEQIYDKRIIRRSCFYEDINDPSDKCAGDTTSASIVFCRTCETDGCNAAPGRAPMQQLPVYVALSALCMLTTKVLMMSK